MQQTSRALWKLTRGFRMRYVIAMVALGVGTFASYLGPLVTRSTVDAIVARFSGTAVRLPAWYQALFGNQVLDRLWLPAAALIAISAGSGFFMFLKGRWAAEASEGAIRQLRDRLFDHLQKLSCRYFDEAETGDLVQRCTSDVETVRMFLASQVVEIGRAGLLLLTVIPLMLALDVRMTLVSLALLPVIVAFSVVFFLRIRPSFQRMDEAEARMTAVLQENLTGIRVVRAFARQEYEIEKFSETVRNYRDHHYGLIQVMAVFWTMSDLLVFLQQGSVLVAGAYWVSVGQLSVGTLVAFLLFINIFIWPIRQMGRILADLGKAMVALGRIEEILAVAPESDAPKDPPVTPLEGAIRLDQVRFRYQKDWALDGVSFMVEPGETLAIVGPSGAGKTTLVNLLLRFYDEFEGEIQLDGHDLRNLPRRWLRRQIGVIMQEPFLYSKTIAGNISLGKADAMHEEIIEAASAAGIHDAIESFPDGYETLVGERGVTLSGGQRQRVALARALLQQPAVLVLDDALSALDTETEAMVLTALQQRHGNQTTLVIAHRLSTLRHADKVLVLDEGRVEQYGTHAALRRAGGRYQRLWKMQTAAAGDRAEAPGDRAAGDRAEAPGDRAKERPG